MLDNKDDGVDMNTQEYDTQKEQLMDKENINLSDNVLSDQDMANMSSATLPREKPKFRSTRWRWLMLTFGCLFLMGSYFCYDIPASLSTTFQNPDVWGLTALQVNNMYVVYSFPNMILPLLGGIFLDKIGIKSGLLLFTIILTTGQLVFAIGVSAETYWLALLGRFIFGLGGECMTVAQSTIVSQWFKGKELAFAFGLNLSVSRLGSTFNGIIEPPLAADKGLSAAVFLGFGICCFSLMAAIGLVVVDTIADKKDGGKAQLSADDKFKWSDIKEFKLPFWLISASCVFVYMSIFPYIIISQDMLSTKFGFDDRTSGFLYSTPYLISAFTCPFIGFAIDKVGKRAVFIGTSSLLIALACIITLMLPACGPDDGSKWLILIPEILLGIGYSIYASALWGSVPYVVAPRTVGTAFGLCTALQNIGLVIAPYSVGQLEVNTTKGEGFFYPLLLIMTFSLIGFLVNIWLYIDDRKNRGGVLDRVDKGEKLEDLITSPPPGDRKARDQSEHFVEGAIVDVEKDKLEVYHESQSARDTLKRSLARQSMQH